MVKKIHFPLSFSSCLTCGSTSGLQIKTYVCETYEKALKEFHFKLFLALALASGATRPCLGVSEHPPNPQFQGLKIDLRGYRRPNYFSRSAPAS